jgi:hypothetical protein
MSNKAVCRVTGTIVACLSLFLFILFSFPAHAQEGENSLEDRNKPFNPFIVYKDKGSFDGRFVPSGYMPTGECIKMEDSWHVDCQEGKSCIKITYDVACSQKGRHWAGIYWLHPADNWGNEKGGYNLTGAKRLVFWARGDKGGERIAEFKLGGVGQAQEYPDSDTASIGPVILSKQWKEYEIDLRGKDLRSISGGFAWVANVDDNPSSCIFYLDNIRYE